MCCPPRVVGLERRRGRGCCNPLSPPAALVLGAAAVSLLGWEDVVRGAGSTVCGPQAAADSCCAPAARQYACSRASWVWIGLLLRLVARTRLLLTTCKPGSRAPSVAQRCVSLGALASPGAVFSLAPLSIGGLSFCSPTDVEVARLASRACAVVRIRLAAKRAVWLRRPV